MPTSCAMPETPDPRDGAATDELSYDSWLGGQLTLAQPRRGHRVGSDAVLLAAAVDLAEGRLVDVGAGVGAVGLAIAEPQRPQYRRSRRDRPGLGRNRGGKRGAQRSCGSGPGRSGRHFRRARPARGRARRRGGRPRRHQPAVLRARRGARLAGCGQGPRACVRGRGGRERRSSAGSAPALRCCGPAAGSR